MSQLDVRQLPENESLAKAPFPAPSRSDFRIHIATRVHQGIAEHAGLDTSVEICGVLVGQWQQDENGPYAVVTDYIRCDRADSKIAEVTFTHESWAQINQEMDTKHTDSRIIGWYHSHPDFGIFLSDRDRFIQENFFPGAGQIAYVVDPVRKLEGIFAWRNGKPDLVSHYWAGDKIVSVEASEKPPATQAAGADGVAAQRAAELAAANARYERSPLSLSMLLAWMCLFLLGYLLASMKTRWERDRIIQGTVAHYGVHKLMRFGFEAPLRETRKRLELLGTEIESLLSLDPEKLDDEQRQALADRKRRVVQTLELSRETLRKVEKVYGYTDLERSALAKYIAAKEAELAGLGKLQGDLHQEESSQRDSEPPGPRSSGESPAQPPPGPAAVDRPPEPTQADPLPKASTDLDDEANRGAPPEEGKPQPPESSGEPPPKTDSDPRSENDN